MILNLPETERSLEQLSSQDKLTIGGLETLAPTVTLGARPAILRRLGLLRGVMQSSLHPRTPRVACGADACSRRNRVRGPLGEHGGD